MELGFADAAGLIQLGFGHGESDVVAVVLVGGLDDQVHIHPAFGEAFKEFGGHAGLIGDMRKSQHRLPLYQFGSIHRPAQFQSLTTNGPGAAAGQGGSGVIAPAGAHHHGDAIVSGDLHGAGMEDGGPEAGQFEHFIAAHLRHELSIHHLAWVGGEDSRHIGVDLTGLGAQGCRQGHCRGV